MEQIQRERRWFLCEAMRDGICLERKDVEPTHRFAGGLHSQRKRSTGRIRAYAARNQVLEASLRFRIGILQLGLLPAPAGYTKAHASAEITTSSTTATSLQLCL